MNVKIWTVLITTVVPLFYNVKVTSLEVEGDN
jgi:hypothetical protein